MGGYPSRPALARGGVTPVRNLLRTQDCFARLPLDFTDDEARPLLQQRRKLATRDPVGDPIFSAVMRHPTHSSTERPVIART